MAINWNDAADFKFQLGDLVQHRSSTSFATTKLVVLAQLLILTDAGLSREYLVRGGDALRNFQGYLSEIELEPSHTERS